jgi:hypothetical protein
MPEVAHVASVQVSLLIIRICQPKKESQKMAQNIDFFRAGVRAALRDVAARQEGKLAVTRHDYRTLGEELGRVNRGEYDRLCPTAEAIDQLKADAEASARD